MIRLLCVVAGHRPAEGAVGDPDVTARRSRWRPRSSTGTSGSPWLPYSMAFIVASLTAVFSRSSRAGSSPRAATAVGDPVHGDALVARLAGQLEARRVVSVGRFVGAIRRSGAGRAPERHERDVVLLLPARAGERMEAFEQLDRAARCRQFVDRHRLAQAREAVHLAARVVRLDEAVRVEQDVVAGADDGLALLVRPCPASARAASRSPATRRRRRPFGRTAGCGRHWRRRPGPSPGRGRRTGRSRTCCSGISGDQQLVRAREDLARATPAAAPRRAGCCGSGP